MQPLDFMAAVLPPQGSGFFCAVELTTRKKEHQYKETLEELEPFIARCKLNGHDTYFALGTFTEAGSRTSPNVNMVKCIAIDVDCNHPQDIPDADGVIKTKAYPSPKAGFEAIIKFADEVGLSGLGQPWFIHSGGGVHAYWPLKEALPAAVWKPVAERFKRLCFVKGLQIDPNVTGDSSRILRIPGTTNNGVKNGVKVRGTTNVRFMNEGDLFDFDDIMALVDKELVGTAYEAKPLPPANVIELPGQRPTAPAPTGTAVKLFENSVTKFKTILEKTKQGTGCGQLSYYIENASDDGMEPLWRGLLSIAQKCEEAPKAVVWLSKMHPYSEDRMETKLREIKGPYPCTKFDSENPGVCTSCIHWGKITNPLALGRQYAVEVAEKVIEVTVDSTARKILRPEPPRGYAYGAQGGVFIEKEDEDADGNKIKRQIMLLPYDLFPVDILQSGTEHTVHMMAIRGNQTFQVTMPQKSTVSKDETLKSLASQNILASFGAGNDKNLYDYIRACVEKVSVEKSPIKVPTSYGWQEDDTMVFAGKIYTPNGNFEVPMPGLENIIANTQPTGSIEAWRDFVNLLIRKKMWKHLAILLAGAGSPLMRFTGIYGLTYHVGSTYSGTGKSLALEAAASIWGHPVHYRTGKGTSPVAMQQRLGLLNSFSLITDEITSKNRKDFDWFAAHALDMTEGRGKERMESGSNKERMNLSTWMSNAIMSSNTHVVDYFTGAQDHAAEGELRRVLEFIIDDVLTWEPHEIEILKSLQKNYAVAGHMFVEFMVRNVSTLKTFVPQVVQRMYTEFKATNDERFWMAGIGANIAAGILWSKDHANIVDIPLEPVINAYKEVVAYMRDSIKAGSRNAEDVLNSFTRTYYGNFIIVKFNPIDGVLAELGNGGAIDASTTRSNIMGRIEHGVTVGCVDYYIEERLLKSFCSSLSFGYADFKRQLEQDFNVSYMPKKDMMSRTKGPQMRVPVLKITRRIDEEELTNQLSVAAA
jgi:hypothetical protein